MIDCIVFYKPHYIMFLDKLPIQKAEIYNQSIRFYANSPETPIKINIGLDVFGMSWDQKMLFLFHSY